MRRFYLTVCWKRLSWYTPLTPTEASHTELEAVLALLEGQADIAFGLQHLASRYNLAFLPLITESVDIIVDRRLGLEPAFQAFQAFAGQLNSVR